MASLADPKVGIGVYTRTIIPSPVVRWILPARIRHRDLADVVFVGEDYVQVHQLRESGQLELIKTHNIFDSRIFAAAVISNTGPSHGAHSEKFIKQEALCGDNHSCGSRDDIPPQSIVLTLYTNTLVALFLRHTGDGAFAFVSQAIALPSFSNRLSQVGQHLAVDPWSRALATAANEKEIVLCSTTRQENHDEDMDIDNDVAFRLISAGQPLRVEGIFQHMAFLTPPNGNVQDHVFLLIIVTDDQARTRAIVLDWHSESDSSPMQAHKGLVLDAFRTVVNMVIPLQDAAFALIIGNEFRIWKNILSGSVASQTYTLPNVSLAYPGNSSLAPMWVTWARSRPNETADPGTDLIYLIREDGAVVVTKLNSQLQLTSVYVGSVGCHVGSAFTCHSEPGEPDILVVGGDMSVGQIVIVERWALEALFDEFTSDDPGHTNVPVALELKSVLPNWASMTDMLIRNTNKVFVTSGRQPFGSITELRTGVQVRLHGYFEMAGLRSVTSVWALPDLSSSDLLLLLSGPDETRILQVTASFDTVEEVEQSARFETNRRTLLAGVTDCGSLVQVTEQGIFATLRSQPSFGNTVNVQHACDGHTHILAASILPHECAVITAERSSDGFHLVYYSFRSVSSSADDGIFAPCQRSVITVLPSRPLSISAKQLKFRTVLVVAGDDFSILAFILARFDGCAEWEPWILATLPPFAVPNVCDHIAILQAITDDDGPEEVLAICGLRDGSIAIFEIASGEHNSLTQQHVYSLGPSSVKLFQSASNINSAIALVDSDSYHIQWNPKEPRPLVIERLWVSDMSRPALVQGPISTCTPVPDQPILGEESKQQQQAARSAENFIMISGDEFLVGTVDSVISTVPRHISVSGTPNRLIYAEKQRCLVCAGLRTGIRTFPSPSPHSPPVEKRQIWPTIDFVPIRNGSASSFTFNMQPGERVYALMEWSFRHDADKIYSFILSAGSYTKSDGTAVKGRVRFLQPINKNWEVTDVKEGHSIKFEHPVYALASYDRITFVAASGPYVYVYRFSIDDKKWEQLCARFVLGSPAHYVTVEDDIDPRTGSSVKTICASTSQDSLVTLHLRESFPQGDGVPLSTYDSFLEPASAVPQAQSNLSHTRAITTTAEKGEETLMITATRLGQVYGIACPPHSSPSPWNTNFDDEIRRPISNRFRSSKVLFEANLKRSLTRIRATTPSIHRRPVSLALNRGIILPQQTHFTGISADGTVTRLVLLAADLCHRLAWLQQLCMRIQDEEEGNSLSAFSSRTTSSARSDHSLVKLSTIACIGLSRRQAHPDSTAIAAGNPLPQQYAGTYGGAADARALHSSADMHIDGDILARILTRPDAEEVIKACIVKLSREDNPSGMWLRTHLADELYAVHDVLDLVRDLDSLAS